MERSHPNLRIAPAIALALALCGCSALTRLSQIGTDPPLTTIKNPKTEPGYQPVSMPMPNSIVTQRRPNSLWQAGSRAFFKDQRASQVGDKDGITNLFGFEQQIPKILPKAATPSSLVNVNGTTNNDGKAAITREEQVTLEVAATVMQVLPNNNMVVQGHQELRVNGEVRDLQITGILRPQDISATNATTLDKLAEARVSYGGRGTLSNDQQARFGEQLLDIVSPF
jgi:flagellar L-ring protein FlgH